MIKKRKKRLRGKVEKVLKQSPREPEKAQIGIEEADELYREIRVENILEAADGERTRLKPGADVDIVIEADTEGTTEKPE